MTDEQLRVRGYLTSQGAKLSPGEIIDKIQAATDQLGVALRAVPGARFLDRPLPEEWSANEVMAHVVTAGRFFGDAVVRLLDGLPGGGVRDRLERDVPQHSADEWRAILERDRAALFERVRQADPQSCLEETVEHPFFGPLNWRAALLFIRLHDLDHAGQIQKIAAAFGVPQPA